MVEVKDAKVQTFVVFDDQHYEPVESRDVSKLEKPSKREVKYFHFEDRIVVTVVHDEIKFECESKEPYRSFNHSGRFFINATMVNRERAMAADGEGNVERIEDNYKTNDWDEILGYILISYVRDPKPRPVPFTEGDKIIEM